MGECGRVGENVRSERAVFQLDKKKTEKNERSTKNLRSTEGCFVYVWIRK